MGKRADGSTVTRTTAHFKTVPYQSMEEANDWELGGKAGTAVSCDNSTSEQMEQGQAADNPLPTSPLGQAPEARNGAGPTTVPTALEGGRRSERQRKSTKEHLQTKYPDFEFQLTKSDGGM